MDELTLKKCRPIQSHAKIVMQWRNDPQTLRMSYHQQPETWSGFWPKFQAQFDQPSGSIHYFAVYKGQKAAYMRLDPCANPENSASRCHEVSINVAPEFRGRGIGSAALILAARHIGDHGGSSLYAEVRINNHASLACFKKAGFHSLARRTKHIADTGENAEIQPLILESYGPDRGGHN